MKGNVCTSLSAGGTKIVETPWNPWGEGGHRRGKDGEVVGEGPGPWEAERYSLGSTTHTRTSEVRSASMWIGTL